MFTFEPGTKYATLAEIAGRKDCPVSIDRLKALCVQGRVLGAMKVVKLWLVPMPLKISSLPNSDKSNRKLNKK